MGLSQLTLSSDLNDLAKWYSKLCADRGELSHNLAPDKDYQKYISKYSRVHELLYYYFDSPSPVKMVWMLSQSATHNIRMIDENAVAMGVFTSSNYRGYYTVIYIGVIDDK